MEGYKEGTGDKEKKKYKEPAPKEFVPTELGSAVFASVNGRPTDEQYLIIDKNKQGDLIDATDNCENDRK